MTNNNQDLRDHWKCPNCAAGVCVVRDTVPYPLEHILFGNRLCGTYIYDGVCSCSDDYIEPSKSLSTRFHQMEELPKNDSEFIPFCYDEVSSFTKEQYEYILNWKGRNK